MPIVDQIPNHDDRLLRGSDQEPEPPLTKEEQDQKYNDWYWDRLINAFVY